MVPLRCPAVEQLHQRIHDILFSGDIHEVSGLREVDTPLHMPHVDRPSHHLAGRVQRDNYTVG